MQIVKPSFHVESEFDGTKIQIEIERYARNCYKSEGKTGQLEDTIKFVRHLLHIKGHEGICDHHVITVRVICDRGVSHELVRHRIAAYLQESTRYCDYAKAGEIQVIEPPGITGDQRSWWIHGVKSAEEAYNGMRKDGASPQIARSVLPNSLKTEIIMTLNLTSWRNFFKKRTSQAAHPQMREIARPMLLAFKRRLPVIFEDITFPGETEEIEEAHVENNQE